jgi:hypothetical protein
MIDNELTTEPETAPTAKKATGSAKKTAKPKPAEPAASTAEKSPRTAKARSSASNGRPEPAAKKASPKTATPKTAPAKSAAKASGQKKASAPKAAKPPQEDPVHRAEDVLDDVGRKLGTFLTMASKSLRRTAAVAKEELEDLWAEAQSIRKGDIK